MNILIITNVREIFAIKKIVYFLFRNFYLCHFGTFFKLSSRDQKEIEGIAYIGAFLRAVKNGTHLRNPKT